MEDEALALAAAAAGANNSAKASPGAKKAPAAPDRTSAASLGSFAGSATSELDYELAWCNDDM